MRRFGLGLPRLAGNDNPNPNLGVFLVVRVLKGGVADICV